MALAPDLDSKPALIDNRWKKASHPTPAVNLNSRYVLPSALAVLLAAVSTADCFGFAEFARGAVTLETEARGTYDSYFIGSRDPNHTDDYFLTLNPELRYSRKAGLAEVSAFAGVSVLRYDRNSEFDSEDFNAGFRTGLPVSEGSRLSGELSLSYNESTVVDYDVMDRIPTKSLGGAFSFAYQLGLKTSLQDSFNYSRSNRSAYSDQEFFGNQFSFLYKEFLGETSLRLTHGYDRTTSSGDNVLGAELDQTANSFSGSLSRPIIGKLVGEATYGYRILHRSAQESIFGQTKQNGSFFSLGLNGPFLPPSKFPKVESSASITYQESRSPGINDMGGKTVTGDVRLSWQARERTKLSFNASRSVDLSANDLSVENTRALFTVSQSVGNFTTLNGSLGYTWRKYRGLDRKDNTFEAALDGRYAITKYWSAGASYSYQDNSGSGTPLALAAYRMRAEDYTRHLVSIFVTNLF